MRIMFQLFKTFLLCTNIFVFQTALWLVKWLQGKLPRFYLDIIFTVLLNFYRICIIVICCKENVHSIKRLTSSIFLMLIKIFNILSWIFQLLKWHKPLNLIFTLNWKVDELFLPIYSYEVELFYLKNINFMICILNISFLKLL